MEHGPRLNRWCGRKPAFAANLEPDRIPTPPSDKFLQSLRGHANPDLPRWPFFNQSVADKPRSGLPLTICIYDIILRDRGALAAQKLQRVVDYGK